MSHAYQLSVCPHDTAKHVVEWFQFNTYLQRKLDCTIHFEPKDSFLLEQTAVLSGGYQIVYANPLSACIYIQELGFIPVARPIGLFDETILVGRAGTGIPEKRPLVIASASGEVITHTLGLSLLNKLKIPREDCTFHTVDTYLIAIHAVLRSEADLAFVYNDTWNSLSEKARRELGGLGETDEKLAFHCFLIAPEWADRKDPIQAVLVGMKNDPKGQLILEALDIQGFEPLSEKAMETLQTLMVYDNTLYNLE